MKSKIVLLIVFAFIATSNSYGQVAFGVSPGIGFNSAYLGYSVNKKIVPFIGFQFFNMNLKFEETGRRLDYDIYQVVDYTESIDLKASMYVPNIGVKYFFIEKNKIKSYALLNISKPFISAKLEDDGEEDEDLKEDIKSISIWGGEVGYGMEYFFDDNFSLGGEFGLRALYFKYENEYNRDIYNPSTANYEETEIKMDYKYNFKPTYVRISFNYYF
jgi:hypothetical protein